MLSYIQSQNSEWSDFLILYFKLSSSCIIFVLKITTFKAYKSLLPCCRLCIHFQKFSTVSSFPFWKFWLVLLSKKNSLRMFIFLLWNDLHTSMFSFLFFCLDHVLFFNNQCIGYISWARKFFEFEESSMLGRLICMSYQNWHLHFLLYHATLPKRKEEKQKKTYFCMLQGKISCYLLISMFV